MANSTIIDRIQAALTNVQGVEFSKVIDQRMKTTINVNAPNPLKARAALCTTGFATAIGAKVIPLRKTIATGFSILIQDPAYGKPLYIRIRKGGVHGRGISNEAGLVATIQGSIDEGIKNVLFQDKVGGSISIPNVVSVRQVGNDAGSRMGNRGDIELMDDSGKAHRISIKKENASGVAGLIKYLKASRLKIQKALKPLVQSGKIVIPANGLVSVPVKNPTMFKYCWFGNDIDEGGGVVIGNFEDNAHFTLNEVGDTTVVNCLRVFSPKDDVNDLIEGDLTGVYLLMRVKVTRDNIHMDVIGARNKRMAARYEIPFDISEITSESELTLESEQERGFRPTIEWMKQKYDEMNHWLFDGHLGHCRFEIFTHGSGSEGRTLGKFRLGERGVRVKRSTRKMYLDDSWMDGPIYIDETTFAELCDPIILLNGNYSGTEHAFLSTLVHEMCHYYTYRWGYCPVQAHGREFKAIAAHVSRKSNGMFTIQRLASAEDMSEYDLDDEFKAKRERRLQNKKDEMKALVVFTKGGEARLTLTKSNSLIDKITTWGEEHPDEGYAEWVKTDNSAVLDFLFDKGYTKAFRTWRWWNIQDKAWFKDFRKMLDDLPKDEKEHKVFISNSFNANVAEESETTSDYVEIDPNMDLGGESPLENM